MAGEFKRKESVRKGVRRLTRRRTRKALEHLAHCDNRLEAVHEVRKQIKQLRALLRLVREVTTRGDYRRLTAALREAGRYLAAARDAHVKVNALTQLTEHFGQELAQHSLAQLERALVAECRKQQAELLHNRATTRVRRCLKNVLRRGASLKLKRGGWPALSRGIQRTYRDGRQAYRLSCQRGTPEDFHQWRKRVKDLYYQIGLLCPIWPEQMKAAAAELKHLGERLGDNHDLFLLIEPDTFKSLAKQARADAETLRGLINERQKELRARALALGARFYREKPRLFCQRLGQYWKRWRREPQRLSPATRQGA